MMHITQLSPFRWVTLAGAFVVSCLFTSASIAECSRSSFRAPPACYKLKLINYDSGRIDSKRCAHPSTNLCLYPKELHARNQCSYPVKVRVVVNKGSDELFTLDPGGTYNATAYQKWRHGMGDGESSAYFRWWTCCNEGGDARCS